MHSEIDPSGLFAAFVTEESARRHAVEMSRRLRDNPSMAAVPAYSTSPEAVLLMIGGAMKMPWFRRAADAVLTEHRRQHGGINDENCEACGYFTAAAYHAQTGRELADDIYGPRSE